MQNAVRIDAKDNVGVSVQPLKKGTRLHFAADVAPERAVECVTDVPQFHKVALKDIAKGDPVIKYGCYIGVATQDIPKGAWVSTQNLASSDREREVEQNEGVTDTPDATDNFRAEKLEQTNSESPNAPTQSSLQNAAQTHAPAPVAQDLPTHFMGYPRSDGRVGIRNKVLILPTSVCASDLAARIAREVPGCVSFHNQNGCSQVPQDQDVTLDALAGFAANPNIYGSVILSLGCEGCQNDIVVDMVAEQTKKPYHPIIIQKVGGIQAAFDAGIAAAKELTAQMQQLERVKTPISELVLGTNCGGSDTTSGLGANPLIGEVSDWLVAHGGTSVLCETSEFFGGEQILAARAKDKKTAHQILKIVKDYEDYVHLFGAEMREGNPSPGNIAGGLTTLEEKSLGCIHKGGHASINNVYPYAGHLRAQEGLVIMDTPGNDPSSVAGLIAGGCQLVLFSTGLGTATGNAIAPVFRITANPNTAKTMADAIDFNAQETIFGPHTMVQIRDQLIQALVACCDGEQTRSEQLGFTETALPHLCNYM